MTGIVILDRDGVINADSKEFIRSPEQWKPLSGSLEAIAALHQSGLLVAVATNQSGVARGLLSEDDLNAIHDHMRKSVTDAGGALAGIFFCPHHPEAGCECRKPKPGLIRRIEESLGISAKGAPFIGDSLRDLESARAGGCRPILVQSGNGARTLENIGDLPEWQDLEVCSDLADAAQRLLSNP